VTAATALWRAVPDLPRAPWGRLNYATLGFCESELPPELFDLVGRMAEGLADPLVTYDCRPLVPGEHFGHGRWHRDSRGRATDVHRLLSWGGPPTEGEGGVLLSPGTVWQYPGTFLHRSLPTDTTTLRILIRVSQADGMRQRNFWRP